MKQLIRILIILALGLSLASCKQDDPDPDPSENDISIREIYDNIVVYEQRLSELAEDQSGEMSQTPQQYTWLNTNEYDTYTRTELLNRYMESDMDVVEGNYSEQLINASTFFTGIKESIADDLDRPLGVPFQPNPNDDQLTYTFLQGEAGYIVIDILYDIHHHIVKIGMSDDKIEYKELHYSYTTEFDPINDPELMFNYFSFTEDSEAVYINSLAGSYDLDYTSIADHRSFTISAGQNRIEVEGENDEIGYVARLYDPENRVNNYLQVVDGEILAETYDVFDQHGLLYRYEDNDKRDNQARLIVNFILATGWDYILVRSDGQTGESTGIYDSDDNALYQGRIRLTYTPTHAYAAFDQEIDPAELSDQDFNLHPYGLNFDHVSMSLDAFEQIQIHDFTGLKNTFQIDNLDFFAENLGEELYQYLDTDIINTLDGTNNPTVNPEPTGDTEAYQAAFEQFYESYEAVGTYERFDDVHVTESHDGEEYTYNDILIESIDANDLYYHGYAGWAEYFLLDVNDALVGFEGSNRYYDYEILYDSATTENFNDFLSRNVSFTSPMRGVTSVSQETDHQFTLELESNALELPIALYITTKEFIGLQDATITMDLTFNDDFTSYEYTIHVEGLQYIERNFGVIERDIELNIDGAATTTSIQQVDFLARDNIAFSQPSSKEDILFSYETEIQHSVILPEGHSYMKVSLDPGHYRIDMYNFNYHNTLEIQDMQGNILSNEDRVEITTSGDYYIVFDSIVRQNGSVRIQAYTPVSVINLELDPAGGIQSQTSVEPFEMYQIIVSSSSEARLLRISWLPDLIETNEDMAMMDLHAEPWEANTNRMCFYDSWEETQFDCYFYFAPEVEYVLTLDRAEITAFAFEYEFVQPSPAVVDIDSVEDLHTIVLGADQQTVRVNFTITEETYYRINTMAIHFESPNFKSYLYTSDGTLLDEFIDGFRYTFTPGDYYIVYEQTTEMYAIIFDTYFQRN